jgi:hypothetical protein
MGNIRIYLSGSLQKGSEDKTKKSVWTAADIEVLRGTLATKFNLLLMNPASRSDDLSDQKSVLGRDLLQVYISDLILVDARDRKGIGIGAEMLFAKNYGIPVISVSPPNSQYRKKNMVYMGQQLITWTHPFIEGLSDFVADSVHEAALYINDYFPFVDNKVKGNSVFRDSMKHYIETQLERDLEMFDIVSQDKELSRRIEQVQNNE